MFQIKDEVIEEYLRNNPGKYFPVPQWWWNGHPLYFDALSGNQMMYPDPYATAAMGASAAQLAVYRSEGSPVAPQGYQLIDPSRKYDPTFAQIKSGAFAPSDDGSVERAVLAAHVDYKMSRTADGRIIESVDGGPWRVIGSGELVGHGFWDGVSDVVQVSPMVAVVAGRPEATSSGGVLTMGTAVEPIVDVYKAPPTLGASVVDVAAREGQGTPAPASSGGGLAIVVAVLAAIAWRMFK